MGAVAPEKKPLRSRYTMADWFAGTGTGQTTFLALIGGTVITMGMIVYANAPWIEPGSDAQMTYLEALWVSWTMFTDPGTQTGVETHAESIEKIVAVWISLSGYVFFLSVMGIVVDVVRKTLDDWKTFKSQVIANEHTLILGWTSKTLFLVQQLLMGQRDLGDDSTTKDIVIMADVTPEELIEVKREVHAFFHHGGEGAEASSSWCGTGSAMDHIQVCSGSLTSDHALIRASVRTSEHIIIMSPELDLADENAISGDAEDIQILGTILSLTSLSEKMKKRGHGGLRSQIIAEVRRPETLEWVYHITTDHAQAEIYSQEKLQRMLEQDGDDTPDMVEEDAVEHSLIKADAMLTDMLVKQLLVRHACQPEIGKALEELLGYEGQDLYIRDFETFTGKTFGAIMYEFDEAIAIGLMVDQSELTPEGDYSNIIVNPADDRVVQKGDKVLFIASNAGSANVRDSDSSKKPKRHVDDPRAMTRMRDAGDSSTAKAAKLVAPPAAAAPGSGKVAATVASAIPAAVGGRPPMVVLVFGWSSGPTMQELLALLDEQVPLGSEIHIISEVLYEERLKMLAPLHVPSWYKREHLGKENAAADMDAAALVFQGQDDAKSVVGAAVMENAVHKKTYHAVPGKQVHHQSHHNGALLRLKNCEVHHHVGPIREPAFVAHMPVEAADVAIILSTAHPSEKGDALLADASAVATLLVLEDLRQERLDFMERSRKEAILRKEMELLPDSACSESSADEYAVPTMASVKESIRKRRESSDRKTIEMKKRGKGQITVLPDQFHGSAIERTDLDAAAPAQLSQCMVVCEIQDPRTQTIIERQSSRYNHVHYYRANKLVAALLAMVAQRESAGIRDVLMRLLRTAAPNFCLVDLSTYVYKDDVLDKNGMYTLSFWDMVARVRSRGDILLGYTSREHEADDFLGASQIIMNPGGKYISKKWLGKHQLVVMSSAVEREHAASKWSTQD